MEDSTLEATSFNQITVDWRRPPPPIDPAQASPWPADTVAIERFQEDGATLLRGVFDEWVEPLRAGLERNLRAPQDYAFPCESAPAGEPGRFFDSYCNWLLIPEYLDHVTHSCAASMAGQLMRSHRAQFFHEHAFCKEPGTQRATPWHQDLPYYCVDGTRTVSLYVSLDEVPAEVAVRFRQGLPSVGPPVLSARVPRRRRISTPPMPDWRRSPTSTPTRRTTTSSPGTSHPAT